MNFLLKILGAKERMEIKKGKLWEVTRLWKMDIFEVEREPVQPLPFVPPPQGGKIEEVRTHELGAIDDKTNLTRRPDLL